MDMDGTDSVPSGEIPPRLPLGSEAELKALLLPLCRALAPLHEAGHFHGSLSWSSIRLDGRGRVQLEDDCGRERSGPVAGRDTQAPLMGVLQDGYAAFEQYIDEAAWPPGPWTDVHALCALAYEAVTGDMPPHAVARMKLETEIMFPESVQAVYSPGLLAAIARGLALDAGRRQQNVQEFVAALAWSLDEPVAQEDMELQAVPTKEQTTLSTRPHTAARAWGRPTLVLTLFLFAAGLGVWAASGNDAGTESPRASAMQEVVVPPVETVQSQVSQVEVAPLETLSTDELPVATGLTVPANAEQPGELASATPSVEVMSAEPEPLETDPEPMVQQAVVMVEMPDPDPVPTSAPAPESVSVAISVQPWGEIFVDGESRGVSPPLRHLKLAPGSYRIRIQNGDLPPGEQQLVVQHGEPARVSHVFTQDGDQPRP